MRAQGTADGNVGGPLLIWQGSTLTGSDTTL